MKKGYTQAYRKELDSNIWKMPPLYQRVFFYLRQTASWESEEFPTIKKFKIALNPGQLITSLSTIADGVSWYEYGTKRTPNKKTIKCILDWLESNAKVTVVSNRYGTFINITNWSIYNSNGKQKVTPKEQQEVTPKKRQLDTLKEENNNIVILEENKKEKKREKERKRELEKIMISAFERFYKYYPKKVGKKKASEAWKKVYKSLPKINSLIRSVKKQKETSQWQDKKYIPNPATWLNGHCWNDEIITEKPNPTKPKISTRYIPEENSRGKDSFGKKYTTISI